MLSATVTLITVNGKDGEYWSHAIVAKVRQITTANYGSFCQVCGTQRELRCWLPTIFGSYLW